MPDITLGRVVLPGEGEPAGALLRRVGPFGPDVPAQTILRSAEPLSLLVATAPEGAWVTAGKAGLNARAMERLALRVAPVLRPLAAAGEFVWPTVATAHLWQRLATGERLTPADVDGWVYLIGCRPDRIKIGFSKDYRRRFASILTGSPDPLDLLMAIPGSREDEQRLHRAFGPWRIRREWFESDHVVEYSLFAADCWVRWQTQREDYDAAEAAFTPSPHPPTHEAAT